MHIKNYPKPRQPSSGQVADFKCYTLKPGEEIDEKWPKFFVTSIYFKSDKHTHLHNPPTLP